MKVGLLTYHHSVSYGATLQTYATYKLLEQLGHEVEIIDLRLEEKQSIFYKFAFSLKLYDTKRLWERCYPPLSKHYSDIESLQNATLDYDCIIVGSDQTWNPQISKNRRFAFFLDFGPRDIRRISFASSFGINSWPIEYQADIPKIKSLLKRFHAISVREREGQILLKDTFDTDAEKVLDPTLAFDDFAELSGNITPNRKLITFIMNRSTQQLRRVSEFGAAYGKRPIMTSTIFPYKGFAYQYPPGIGQWLRNIGGADFVIIDSFHALVFCIKYKKPFAVITPDNGKNSRLLELLRITELEYRFFNDENEHIPYQQLINETIDYNKVERLLNQEKEKTIEYLRKSLS